jgi:hypothetical protein
MITTGSLSYAKSVNSAFDAAPALRAMEAPGLARPTPRRLRRLFRRDEPTTFQRCFAVHLYFATMPGALD